jgi:hypothetical protein
MSISNKIFTVLAKEKRLPVMNLSRYFPISNQFFSGVFASYNTDKYSFDDFNESLGELTDNKLSIEANSLYYNNDDKNPEIRCVMHANTEVRPYSDESVGKMMPIQANLFTENDNIWKVVGEGDNRQLIQVSREDYVGMLENRRKIAGLMTASDSNSLIPFASGDYVSFFNHNVEKMDFGTVARTKSGQILVASLAYNNVLEVKPCQIIEAAVTEDRIPVLDGAIEFKKLMAMIWGKKSEYYRNLEKAFSARRIKT